MLIDLSLLAPPLLAGLIVLSTHVPLGRQVLSRGIIFIDLAVAQMAALGVILIHAIHEEPAGWLTQLFAFLAALGGALALRWAERHWADVLEAIIGVVFVLSVTAALIVLANDPHGGDSLKEVLAGQLLWVTYDDLWLPLLLSALMLLVWFRFNGKNNPTVFYIFFAVSVTISVQMVGVYLVFASLIIPALATRKYPGVSRAYLIGILGYLVGLLVSVLLDSPAGPVIVWVMALLGLFSALVFKKSSVI